NGHRGDRMYRFVPICHVFQAEPRTFGEPDDGGNLVASLVTRVRQAFESVGSAVQAPPRNRDRWTTTPSSDVGDVPICTCLSCFQKCAASGRWSAGWDDRKVTHRGDGWRVLCTVFRQLPAGQARPMERLG